MYFAKVKRQCGKHIFVDSINFVGMPEENYNGDHSELPSTSVGVAVKRSGDAIFVERPAELMPLRRGNNVPIRRGSHTKTGRIATSAPTSASADASRSPSLERPHQWQCQAPQPTQSQAWWQRRSVVGESDMPPKGESGDMSASVSPASTPASSRASDFVGGAADRSGSGTQSKSSSRSGSSRSAFRIFKPGGSQSIENSKARIVSSAPFSHSPSVTRNGVQKHDSSATSTASQCAAMRASFAVASAPSKSALKLIHVHTLSKQNIVVSVERKCQVWDVFHSCCVHLGIDDDRLFGLALRRPCEGFGGAEDRPRHEYFFLDPEQKVSKYVPKEAKSSSATSAISSPVSKLKGRSRGCGVTSKPIIVLYMRVRVYVRRIDAISCDVALRHYYLQLRENLIDQWSAGPHSGASEEACWGLAALAILTDRGREWRSLTSGDSTASVPANAFAFRAEQYFPLWVINARGLDYVQENMPKVLRGYGAIGGFASAASSLGGGGTSTASTSSSSASQPIHAAAFTETDAMFQFCQEASRGPFALNCHLYSLRRQKTDILNNALIGITDKGIDLWDVGLHGERVLLRSLTWARLSCLSFDNKRITIAGLDGSRLVFYAESESKARYLLAFCKEVHQQLLQINTNFVMNRPPSSPLLPPGWGIERLIDASPLNAPTTRRFHSADYGLPAPTFSPRSDSNQPEITSFNAAVVNHQLTVEKPTQQSVQSATEEAEESFGRAEIGQTLGIMSTATRSPAPARSREAINPPAVNYDINSFHQNLIQPTTGAQKVRRFKKAGYERRASSPIAVRRIVSGDDGPVETSKNLSNARPESVSDVATEQMTSLEAAMNAAPSPPKYALNALSHPSPASGVAVTPTMISTDSTVSMTPKSALKRPNSSKQTQIPISAAQSTSHDMQNTTVYGSSIMSHHYQQQIAAYHPINNGQAISAKGVAAPPAYVTAMPPKLTTAVVTTTTTKLRPPPQYAEAVEQLRRRNNLSTQQSQSEDENYLMNPQQHQQQLVQKASQNHVLCSQYAVNGESMSNHVAQVRAKKLYITSNGGEAQHPGYIVPIATANDKKQTNSHFHQRHESGSRTVSGIDTDTLTRLQKNFEPTENVRKYTSVVNDSKKNHYDQRTSRRDSDAIESNQIRQFEQMVTAAYQPPQSETQQPFTHFSQTPAMSTQMRRYASQSPTARNRIKDISVTPAKLQPIELRPPSFPSVQKQHPAVVIIEKQVPFYGHAIAKEAASALTAGEHAKEPSISNTEKFKNYPMMKALWEARHDLAAADEAASSQQPIMNGDGNVNSMPPPPPYAQYVQHHQYNNNQSNKQSESVSDVEAMSSTFAVFPPPQPASGGNTAPSVVMDLPPPPPYPQGAMATTVQRSPSAGRKAAVM